MCVCLYGDISVFVIVWVLGGLLMLVVVEKYCVDVLLLVVMLDDVDSLMLI